VPNTIHGKMNTIRSKNMLRTVLAFTALLALTACDPPPPEGSAGELRGVLNLGLLPDENPKRQAIRYAPLIEAIRSRTGLDVELVLPETYDDLVSRFADGTLDLAYFGGYTFVLASERYGAIPLVMRDIDARFISHVLVHRDNTNVQGLADLQGSHFSFGSRRSTSGHIMPRHYFSRMGIIPEEFFSHLTYSGSHDRTVQLVAEGSVDAGVANGQIVRQLLSSARHERPPVRVLWQSPAYVDYVWATQPSMSENTRQALKSVFLSLDTSNETHRRFLDAVGAGYYLPAAESDFHELRQTIATLDASVARQDRP